MVQEVNSNNLSINSYQFPKYDFLFYFKNLAKDRGIKAFYQFLNRAHRRSYSRSLIKKYAPDGIGLEVGVGARTIAPSNRTILSDAFSEHGVHGSIAKVYFKGDSIPYPTESFSFLLSEHVLEHIVNPIKTLKEWIRVIKVGGMLILFLPHKERTNDKYRVTTTLEHLIEDYNKNVDNSDETHIDEWFTNVVQKGLMPNHYQHLSREELIKTCSIHQHNWTEVQIAQLLEYLNMKVVFKNSCVYDRRDSFVVIAKKI